MELTKNCAS